jgi:hypothetical protein
MQGDNRGFGIFASDNCDINFDTENGLQGIFASANSTIGRGFTDAIIASTNSTINGNEKVAIIASNNSSSGFANQGVIIGSAGCSIQGSFQGMYSSEASSYQAGSNISSVIATYNSHIQSNGYYNGFAWTYQSIINKGGTGASGENMVALACREVTIDKERAVMIGVSGYTSAYSATTHSENAHTYKTESFGVINAGSVGGNIDVDCSLGTMFLFTLTANTTPNFINFRDGQRITFVVKNSTYSVADASIRARGDVYAKNGSIAPSNNNKSLYYGTFMSGDLYIDEHTGFDAV